MKEKFLRYIPVFLLSIQVFVLGYLSIYFFINDTSLKYEKIVISGNKLLPAESYLHLITSVDGKEKKSLNNIKTKLEEHPYIFNADVRIKKNNILEINLEEKRLNAIILEDNITYFITDLFEFIKILPQTFDQPLPFLVMRDNIDYFEKNDKIKSAFQIIDCIRELNNELLEKLTQINLSRNREIVLLFKNLNAPILLNKSNLVKELFILSEFINSDKFKYLDEKIKYIDLRFNNQIIIG